MLQGNFELTEENERLKLSIDETYKASSALPIFFIYLTSIPTTTANAYEVGVAIILEGVHEFIIEDWIAINDYSHILYFYKPFNVKIGNGEFIN